MLRSSLSRSLGQGRLQQQLARYVPPKGPNSLVASQRRHYQPNFVEKIAATFKLPKLKQTADANPNNEYAVAEYVKLLAGVDPNGARVYIERGWQAGSLPMNENFLRTYLQAVANMGKLDSLHVTGLLNMLNKNGTGDATPTFTSTVAPTGRAWSAAGAAGPTGSVSLGSIFGSASTVGAGGESFGAGQSPHNPLHVTMSEYNWKGQLGKVIGFALCAFITYVLVLSAMDEKAPGAAPGVGGGGNPFGRFGMSSAVHQVEKSDKSFDDVVGVDEAKTDLQEIVLYLKDPKRFTRLGGKLPKGVLLTGPPGTGKTLLARAIAGEAGVPFFHASGSEFEEMFVGVGAKRVRELFEVAKNKAPCIIFIDEIDAIGGSRQLKDQSAMKMTLNQLLVEMDGFAQNNGVIVIAATNFPDSLDAALIRPGRFDKRVEVSMPDIGGRKAILSHYGQKIPLDSDVDMEQLARGTPGFSGADLFNLMNTAALKASVENLKAVNMASLEFAKDKILMGAERKSAVISAESMKLTAFHEAGHALVALKTQGADPIHKATIMPRGRALGMVTQLPDGDQTSFSKHQMLARLDVCMGGRVAEELIYGADHVTSGATSDLQQATNLARNMVTKYGLSSKIGSVFFDDKRAVSPEIQRIVDEEVKAILDASYARAKALLEGNRKELEAVALGLIEFESLSGSEIADLVAGSAVNAKKRSQRPSRDMKELVLLKDVAGTGNVNNNNNSNVNNSNSNNSNGVVKSSSSSSVVNNNSKTSASSTPSSSATKAPSSSAAASSANTNTNTANAPSSSAANANAPNAPAADANTNSNGLRPRGPPRPDGKTSS